MNYLSPDKLKSIRESLDPQTRRRRFEEWKASLAGRPEENTPADTPRPEAPRPEVPPAPSSRLRGLHRGVMVPGWGAPVKPICDVSMVANVVRNTPPAATSFLTMAPIRTNYFQPLAETLQAIDTVTPDLNRRVEIQTIEINDVPQEAFSNRPTVGSVNSALSDFFGSQFDGYGKPVAYGIYSQAALLAVFMYGFSNIEVVTVDLYGIHYGNPLDVLPPGYVAGTPFI